MNFQILQSAEEEIAEGMDYYNEQYSGLGYEFAVEIKEGMNRIKLFPEAWPQFIGKIRISHINRFPYGILYEVRQKSIIVFAVMHLKQSPEKWEDKLKKYSKT